MNENKSLFTQLNSPKKLNFLLQQGSNENESNSDFGGGG